MSGHGEKLTRKEEAAISALLTQATLAEAAEVAGIGEATLRRWLHRDDFQTAYRAARREAVGQAIARLQHVTTVAVNTLEAVMTDPAAKESAKVTAARAVLELALRSVELEDLEVRIAVLEQRIAETNAGGSSYGR
jgi:hypothetical protein